MDAVWLTWERQQRNRSMAKELGIECREIVHDDKKRVDRYLRSVVETVQFLREQRPKVVIFQNPSLVLGLFLVCLKASRLAGRFRLIGDFHNAGVEPSVGKWLTRFIARQSDLVIVTNENLAKKVRAWGADALAIPDPLPTLVVKPREERVNRRAGPAILFICSWASDEPVENVIEAARLIEQERPTVRIKITGRPRPARLGGALPRNVQLAGYLTDDEFHRAIAEADLVMDLTTRNDCMVCGAYEGLSFSKPLLLSANEPTMEWFRKGALFTSNTSEDIAHKVLEACRQMPELREEASRSKVEVVARFRVLIDQLGSRLSPG